jgi:hypothetical protein
VLLLLPFAVHALRFSEAKPKKPMLKDKSLDKADVKGALKDKSVEKAADKALEGAEMEYELACTADARKIARMHIEAKNWADLKQDVCVKGFAEEVERLESGKGDVEDIGEWLDGDIKVPVELKAHKQEQKEKGATCQQLPKLLYIGMGHSGSTTLSAQLNGHPDLSFGQMKEHRFHFDKGSPERNIAMYKKNFQMNCQTTAFDGSIGYIFYTPERIEALKKTVGPDVKILLMMRDPAKWMNSLYHDGGDGLSKGHNGCYADFLEEWLKHFPREQFLIEASEDYFKDPQATLDRVADHVGVKKIQYPPSAFAHAAGRRRSGAMAKQKMAEYKADPHNVECAARLQILSNKTFPWAQEMIKAAKTGEKLEK